MSFGFRKPIIKKRISACSSIKLQIIHLAGLKCLVVMDDSGIGSSS